MCEPDKFKQNGYHGVPSLIVEILSSNRKDDLETKFKLYERIGVGEYWIIDPSNNIINQYVLVNDRYNLVEVYNHLLQEEFEELDDEEQAEHKTFITPNLFKELDISLGDIFKDTLY
ncbi:MAG: hypothetical protein ATN35_03745 [Epulopiscium sp. Nele67-Bin004]|nr:MAG: hypothetical protein ATN35_03745 [Epulopiscium sp. Nele67-Bin004]